MEKQKQINYVDIIALGFKEEAVHDAVFEDIHGYPYKIFSKGLGDGIYIDWQQDTRLCKIIRSNPKNGDIYAEMPLNSLEQIRNIIAFYSDDVQ